MLSEVGQWLLALQALMLLAFAVGCVLDNRRQQRDSAAQWQALAELRMHHNALESATVEALTDIWQVIADLDAERSMTPAPVQQCNKCREQQRLRTN